MDTIRDTVRAALDELAPTLSSADRLARERQIIEPIVLALVRCGCTVARAAAELGTRDTTIRGWAKQDPAFAAALDAAAADPRGRLDRALWRKIESKRQGEPGVGAALRVQAHRVFPELREHKVEAHVTTATRPGESRAKILEIVNRGKPVDPEPESV